MLVALSDVFLHYLELYINGIVMSF